MITANVQIVHLAPMRVASTYGFGDHPEDQAWQKMVDWATPRGFLEDIVAHPIFGFNNPYPTPDNPRYGYEFLMKVGQEVEPEGEVRIEEFFGGTYAVTRCEVQGNPAENVPSAWKSLADWCRTNNHPLGNHHALERFLNSPANIQELVLDLYCPIIS